MTAPGELVECLHHKGRRWVPTDAYTDLLVERDRYRTALLSLHRTAERLMASDDEDNRGVGCALAEVTRIVVEPVSAA